MLTPMYREGSVQGDAANRYPDFRYRQPVREAITLSSVRDYILLIEGQEYPRWNRRPESLSLKVRELADYAVIGHPPEDGTCMGRLEVVMLPGQYTHAKRRQVVLEVMVAYLPLRFEEHARLALDEAFRAH